MEKLFSVNRILGLAYLSLLGELLPHSAEAMALTVSALGALDRHTGVHTINLNLDGKLHAIALIEGATFEQCEGNTALIQVDPKETP